MIRWFLAVVGALVSYIWLWYQYENWKELRAIRRKYQGGCRDSRVSLSGDEGHEILLLDLTYCTPQEAMISLQEFKQTLLNYPPYSIFTTRAMIDLTDGRLTPQCMDEMKRVITENQRYFARLAFAGSTLLGKHRGRFYRYFLCRYPFFRNREDALDFVEHDDQYPLYYPAGSTPRQRTAARMYDIINLCELFSRLLRYPDDEYWTTTERCLEFFQYARTKKLRLMSAFADNIKNLSTKELQALYSETFERDPTCSLRLSWQLPNEKPQQLTDWMERKIRERNVTLPVAGLPIDHISIGLLLLSHLSSAAYEDFLLVLSPAIENLVRLMKGHNNPFESLLRVVVLALDPGADTYVVEQKRILE